MLTDVCLQNARNLSSHVVTNWENYDFTETSKDLEKRVPIAEFVDVGDIDVNAKEPEYVKGFCCEKFIRKYEITYLDRKYLFVITVDSYFGCVRKFFITAYHTVNGEEKKLFTQNL